MEERHEIISFSTQMPLKVFIHRLGSVPKHWHNSIEILFVLSGEVMLTMDDRCITLKPDDVVLINSNSLHELYAESSELAAFQIKLSEFDIFKEYSTFYFDCCSAGDTHNHRYDYLRYLLARLIKDNSEEENLLSSLSLTARLLSELVSHFKGERTTAQISTQKHLDRLKNITDYIQKNFRVCITLTELAEHEHLSVSYLSRFFTQYFGMTFSQYYNNVRLEHAVNELMSSDESITAIAMHNGYTDARSFVSSFRSRYGDIPSNYRKSHKTFENHAANTNNVNYFSVSNVSALSNLASYLKFNEKSIAAADPGKDTKSIDVSSDFQRSQKVLSHNFRKVCCVGSGKDILLFDVQEMLRKMQKDIHFEFVKFHGLLCDDLMLYDEMADGTPTLSFVLLDKVMDFLLSIDLRPILQLSFMPSKMASIPDKHVFYVNYNTSAPQSMARWTWLVEQVIRHFVHRYSLAEVLRWPVCVWNEPDMSPNGSFGIGDDAVFYELYKKTWQTVKSIHPDFFFGTPSLQLICEDLIDWDYRFLDYCRTHHCLPDFFNIHFYNNSLDTLTMNAEEGAIRPDLLKNDENAFSEFIDNVNEISMRYFDKIIPTYLTEWNLTVSHRNPINDTCFKSCYIAKNLLENYDRLDAFGYWSMTDLIGESQPSNALFHGGLGMFTYNGIEKPPYYVYKYLSRLGSTLLGRGDGWFMTRTDHGIRLALYNYEHYNRLFASGELFDMTATNRYTPFTMTDRKTFHITVDHIEGQMVRISEYYVNREYGSCFDQWVKIGAPEDIYPDDMEMLKNASQPGLYIHQEKIREHSLKLNITLEPLEFRFVEAEIMD